MNEWEQTFSQWKRKKPTIVMKIFYLNKGVRVWEKA